MMTPQEVANCTFAKAVMGGYNMASVDDFLDKLTEDYAALYKENAALKSKLKVVADKLEEYREVEDAMRSTLLTAQKMASSMVSEAEAKRDALIADAAGAAKRRLEEIQQELADQLHVTRQAVSRWERGETTPNPETLKQLSALLHVSINTLLGVPRQLVCQSCGMPLEDDIMGHDAQGLIDQRFCKWCYDNGAYLSECTMEEMAETCADIMAQEGVPREAALAHMNQVLPTLDRWRRDG